MAQSCSGMRRNQSVAISTARPRSARRSKKPSTRGRISWSRPRWSAGYCIGDLVENADFLTANDRAMQRIAQAARGITAVIGFIDYNLHEQNDNGTVRKYNAAAVVRDGRILQRAEVAASQLSLLRRQAVFHTWRIARTGRCRDAARTSQRRGLDLRGHVGRVLRRRSRCPS